MNLVEHRLDINGMKAVCFEQAGQDHRGVTKAQLPASRSSGCQLVHLSLPPQVWAAAQGEPVHREPHPLEKASTLQGPSRFVHPAQLWIHSKALLIPSTLAQGDLSILSLV